MDVRSPVTLPPIFQTWMDPATWFVREGNFDYISPLLAFHLIRKTYRPSFLLESAAGPEKLARFSIIAFDPLTHLSGRFDLGDTWYLFEEAASRCFAVHLTDDQLPWGIFLGWYGFVSYEMPMLFEPVQFRHPHDLDIPDFYFMFPGQILVFDHLERKVFHLYHGSKEPWSWKIETERLPERLFTPFPERSVPTGLDKMGPSEAYRSAVEKAKRYIKEGDIFQVVLSQRFERSFEHDPLDLYRILRTLNPSPYMFFLSFNGTTLMGSSPEMLIRQENDRAWIRPIAGTRQRGSTEEEDQHLSEELLQDEKERAEHTMLVDLARNDLGRVARAGEVRVVRLMDIEKYSHVLHLTSEVEARIRDDVSPLEVLAAGFPAGTVTGAPKIRAMEIIDELETSRRQFYAGGVGYIGMHRRLNFCITIRSTLIQRERMVVQAGAGIVADSIPEREDEECRHKARALFTAAELVEKSV